MDKSFVELLILKKRPRNLWISVIKKAEKIAKNEFNFNRIAIISGVGVREYFSKLKYKLRETYMVKRYKLAT